MIFIFYQFYIYIYWFAEMLSLVKQCASLSISSRASLLPASSSVTVQTRDFWRLWDSRYTDDRNKLAKYPQKSIDEENIFDSRQEMAKDGYGITLFSLKDGTRGSLKPVVARFKRLDWGVWIR